MQRLNVLLLIHLMLAACAPATPAITPAGTRVPEPVTQQVTPARYETAALTTRWDEDGRIHQLSLVEPSTGRPVPGYAPIDLGGNYYYTFSPDRSRLVILAYRPDDPRDPVLHNLDLAGWQDTQTVLPFTGWAAGAAGLTISPDGRYLALAANHSENTLLVFDLERNEIVARILPEFDVLRLKFTADGDGLMTYGTRLINRFSSNEQTSGFATVALFAAHDLGLLWSSELTGLHDGTYPAEEAAAETTNLHEDPASAVYFHPGLVFAPDADRLYAVHADEYRLTTIDFAGRSTSTIPIQPELSWFERLLMLGARTVHAKMTNGTARSAVISPDGTIIYTIGTRNEAAKSARGEWEFASVPLGLQAIDPFTGLELFKRASTAVDLRLTPDGRALLLQNWDGPPSTDMLELETVVFAPRIELAITVPTRRMNGTPLLVSALTDQTGSTQMRVHWIDGSSLGEWRMSGYGEWLIVP